jgi:hypothetical protein
MHFSIPSIADCTEAFLVVEDRNLYLTRCKRCIGAQKIRNFCFVGIVPKDSNITCLHHSVLSGHAHIEGRRRQQTR